MAYKIHVSCAQNVGTTGQEPARARKYTIIATPAAGGSSWRSKAFDEQAYRTAAEILIPEKEAALLAITAPGEYLLSGIGPGEIIFSLEEIQGMGLIERLD